MSKKLGNLNTINLIIGVSALILFTCSTVKHLLFKSTALDLAIFDQVVYLISQGEKPISSLIGFHILGDHAAWIFYPLAVLYKIYPSVYWLFAVQAVALALGALPIYQLAQQAGLKQNLGIAVAAAYLLYPLVFNISLFDFHPDVIAVPALLTAVWATRARKIGWFCVSIILVFGCKAVLSLTVAALGVWLLVFEQRRLYGAIALLSGIAWFIIATKGIIPYFGGSAASVDRHIYRYSYLGNSFPEMIKNFLFHPGIVLGKVFSLANLEYLILLVAPVIWSFSLAQMTPLIAAIPTLVINILADYRPQKDLIHQYSLSIIPFLFLVVINSLAAGRGWFKHKRAIILWSLVAFLALAKYGHFGGKYLSSLDTWQATREAIALVKPEANVLTLDETAPHLSQRKVINLLSPETPEIDFAKFDYILLNTRHTFSRAHKKLAINYVTQLKNHPKFKSIFHRNDVYLFEKSAS
ncbi:DUF2079 domain-containing protein [Iningainema tapete]|uniref:DUF2079 domain-containing protein n=1 Tax=Iningainema tapete BLCC-T55 TaxID=2748662 RepID=A0A8J6XLE0_9CYAN|nr:DUF2079 domain-containing protein [Iningainema tapete]MBD2774911.1 DUF2079 domain-containing protein [Iningainema tapete BLCC-T55]